MDKAFSTVMPTNEQWSIRQHEIWFPSKLLDPSL